MSRSEHPIEHFDARGVARVASDLRIRKWRLRAEECRAVAESMRDTSRAPLLAMAEHCERMADDAEFGFTRERD
jgi:hypothetical protein